MLNDVSAYECKPDHKDPLSGSCRNAIQVPPSSWYCLRGFISIRSSPPGKREEARWRELRGLEVFSWPLNASYEQRNQTKKQSNTPNPIRVKPHRSWGCVGALKALKRSEYQNLFEICPQHCPEAGRVLNSIPSMCQQGETAGRHASFPPWALVQAFDGWSFRIFLYLLAKWAPELATMPIFTNFKS